MAGRSLRIGELAAQVSLRPAALRYYEQIGLIPLPSGSAASARTRRRLSADRVDQDGAASRFASC